MKKVILSIVLGLSVLTACAPRTDAGTSSQTQNAPQQPQHESAPTRTLYDTVQLDYDPHRLNAYRFIDHEAGVVCYSTDNRLSCLPISQTLLASQAQNPK